MELGVAGSIPVSHPNNMINKDYLRAAKILTRVLDEQFKILGIKIGFDPVLDLIPVLGSFIGAGFSLYLVWLAWKVELPEDLIAKMIRNIIIDLLIGEIPLVGWIGDIFYKSNRMNLEILQKHMPTSIIERKVNNYVGNLSS